MKKYFLTASLVALMATGHVHAADVVQTYDAPEVAPTATAAPAFEWDGIYVGGQIGSSWSDTDISSRIGAGTFIIPPMTPLNLINGNLLDFSADASGFIGGVYAGYNFDLGNNVIIGLEQDFVWGDVDEQTGYKSFDMSTLNGGSPGYLNARLKVEQKWAGATRIRVGYAMDRVLPYLSAGVAYGKVKSSVDAYLSATPLGPNPFPVATGNPNAGIYKFSDSDTFTGWTIGTGADYALTDNVLLRFEYRYADYGSETYTRVIPGGGTSTISYTVDHKTHDIRVGVAYKF